MSSARQHNIWFEKVYARLHLPYWAGILVLGFFPIIVLFPVSYAVGGVWSQMFTPGGYFTLLLLLVMVLLVHLGASYTESVMNRWKKHADDLLADDKKVDLRELFGLRGFLAFFVILLSVDLIVFVFFALPGSLSVTQRLAATLPWDWWNVYADTFFWMFAYSMYRIFRTGRLPMRLKSFTEDRMLGLRPFGRVSLQLTGLYFGFVVIALIAEISQVGIETPGILLISGFILLGVGLFFIPQMSLHGKLVRAKQEAYAWIAPQHTKVMEVVRRQGVENTEEKVLNQLSGVDSIRRDIAQIYSWPFDLGVVARLSAIVLSVVAILLSAVLRNFLGI